MTTRNEAIRDWSFVTAKERDQTQRDSEDKKLC